MPTSSLRAIDDVEVGVAGGAVSASARQWRIGGERTARPMIWSGRRRGDERAVSESAISAPAIHLSHRWLDGRRRGGARVPPLMSVHQRERNQGETGFARHGQVVLRIAHAGEGTPRRPRRPGSTGTLWRSCAESDEVDGRDEFRGDDRMGLASEEMTASAMPFSARSPGRSHLTGLRRHRRRRARCRRPGRTPARCR